MQVPRGPESEYIGVNVSLCPVSNSTLKGPLHAFYHQAKQRVQCDGYVCEEIGRYGNTYTNYLSHFDP